MKHKIFKRIGIEDISKETRIILRIVTIIIGLCCIIFYKDINHILPYIIGIDLAINSIANFINAIKTKEYTTLKTSKTSKSIVTFILAIVILIRAYDTIYLIAIIWGLYGLRKGIEGLNIVLYNKVHNKKYILELVHALIETVLAILLILEPFHSIEHHIILLGIEMIFTTLKYAFKDRLYNGEEKLEKKQANDEI